MASTTAAAFNKARVFAGYRRIFRARKKLFVGDALALRESRKAIKGEFEKNKAAPSFGDHFEGLLGMVDEAVDMMTTGIMQGKLNPATGNYAMKVKPEHVSGAGHATVQPITPDVVSNMESRMQPPKVEVSHNTDGVKSK
ncbi:hypothetical protein ACA910_003841 [Epithemia clementina (nom. ined.)]